MDTMLMHGRIEEYDYTGLEGLVSALGQPRFRASQLFEWLYGKGVHSYADMTNLPAAFRKQLAAAAPFSFPVIVDKRTSSDGTRKYVFELHDKRLVEAVGIPSHDTSADATPKRLTVCFSTQVGCPMRCSFCATGKEGFTRNLLPGEMAWQVVAVSNDFGRRASNAVAMGQGEPFLNYENLVSALRILNHPKGPGIGARHITVSTCGIADGIRRFAHLDEQFTLAVSLHAAKQDVRDSLMPGCAHIALAELNDAIRDYQQQAGRRVTFEYMMVDGVNSSRADLEALISYCEGLSAHVNLLPVNAVEGSDLHPCSGAVMQEWLVALESAGIGASVRTSRGSDICGACGQLKNSLGQT